MRENGICEFPLAISPVRALAQQCLISKSEWTSCSEPPGFGPIGMAITTTAQNLYERLTPMISVAGSEYSIGVRHTDEGR